MLKIKDITELQKKWNDLKQNHQMTKKAICDLCIPFRDKFGLTDILTLKLARNELSLIEIDKLLEE